ncbi:MAG TPA: PEGA domain-containing protein [Vicinamibacterales bacterium]
MSAYKRLIPLFALAAVVILGSAQAGFGGQWGYPYPPPYPMYGPPDSSVRLEVTPKQAQVFVDGYYAGIVDDYDGAFQRLHTPPGAHEIELYMEGYHVARQKVFLPVNETFKIKYQMVKLAPSDQPEQRPEPIAQQASPEGGGPPEGYTPQGGSGYPPQNYPPQGQGQPRPPSRRPPPQQPQNAPEGAQNGAYGTLAVRVQPGDAEVSIDGDQWRGPDQSDRLVVQVSEGSHTVEIRKSGYRTYVTQVDVHRGATTPINVSLHSQDQQ